MGHPATRCTLQTRDKRGFISKQLSTVSSLFLGNYVFLKLNIRFSRGPFKTKECDIDVFTYSGVIISVQWKQYPANGHSFRRVCALRTDRVPSANVAVHAGYQLNESSSKTDVSVSPRSGLSTTLIRYDKLNVNLVLIILDQYRNHCSFSIYTYAGLSVGRLCETRVTATLEASRHVGTDLWAWSIRHTLVGIVAGVSVGLQFVAGVTPALKGSKHVLARMVTAAIVVVTLVHHCRKCINVTWNRKCGRNPQF